MDNQPTRKVIRLGNVSATGISFDRNGNMIGGSNSPDSITTTAGLSIITRSGERFDLAKFAESKNIDKNGLSISTLDTKVTLTEENGRKHSFEVAEIREFQQSKSPQNKM